jgi:hypothetical protein
VDGGGIRFSARQIRRELEEHWTEYPWPYEQNGERPWFKVIQTRKNAPEYFERDREAPGIEAIFKLIQKKSEWCVRPRALLAEGTGASEDFGQPARCYASLSYPTLTADVAEAAAEGLSAYLAYP